MLRMAQCLLRTGQIVDRGYVPRFDRHDPKVVALGFGQSACLLVLRRLGK
jgi:hypothetical protein